MEQKITQEFTIEPRGGGGPSKQVETLGVRRADATSEMEQIEQAVSRMFDTDYRCILTNRYIRHPKMQHDDIAKLIHVENTRYFEMRRMALLAFAEQYRNAVLVVET
nr:MAG TPA: transcriptional regulator [Caudoviricetes sp.]